MVNQQHIFIDQWGLVQPANVCIYLATNLIDGKKYVGQTKDFKVRWAAHCRVKKPRHTLAIAVREHGIKNFEWQILADGLPKEVANKVELEFIKLLRSAEPEHGYNRCPHHGYRHLRAGSKELVPA